MVDIKERLADYGLTLEPDVVICDRRTVDEAVSRIAELEAENERLRQSASDADIVAKHFQSERDHLQECLEDVLEQQALSRTGAVKVEGPRRCATDGCDQPATNEFIRGDVGSFYCGDCFGKVIEVCEARRSPEGQQPVAYRVHAPADEHYGIGPDRLQFHPLTQYDLDNGYRQTPLYHRHSEQAVTEAARSVLEWYERDGSVGGAVEPFEALKAAMEAGR